MAVCDDVMSRRDKQLLLPCTRLSSLCTKKMVLAPPPPPALVVSIVTAQGSLDPPCQHTACQRKADTLSCAPVPATHLWPPHQRPCAGQSARNHTPPFMGAVQGKPSHCPMMKGSLPKTTKRPTRSHPAHPRSARAAQRRAPTAPPHTPPLPTPYPPPNPEPIPTPHPIPHTTQFFRNVPRRQ